MAREIPEVVRAAAGLAATVLDEARKLPEKLPGLPVRLIGLAMQTAMKIQQGYSGLVARGDEVFTGIRGEQEPGLATFDDEVEAQTGGYEAETGGYRESAFDRADVSFADNEVAGLPDQEADAAVAAVEELADQISTAQEALDATAAEAPSAGEVLDELAVDEQLEAAPPSEAGAAAENALLESDRAGAEGAAETTPPAEKATGGVAPASVVTAGEAAVDEALGGETAPAEGGNGAAPADEGQGRGPSSGSQAVGVAPVEGYDGWSIAQLRGRLRGYAERTVQELLDYEQATQAREPYLRMLRNRLERLQAASA